MYNKLALVVIVSCLLAIGASSSVHAGSAGFVLIGAGSSYTDMDFDIVAQSGSRSLDLEHVLGYDKECGIDFSVSIPRDCDTDRVRIVYVVGAKPTKENAKDAFFDPTMGWTFRVNPIVDPQGRPVPIHIGMVDRKGKRDFIRLGLKLTPSHRFLGFGPHETREYLTFWAMPQECAPTRGSSGESALERHIEQDQAFANETTQAIQGLIANDAKLAQDLNEVKAYLRGGSQTLQGGSQALQGDYRLRVTRNGQPYSGKIWVRKFDAQNPSGLTAGPFMGPDVMMRNAELGVNRNGVVQSCTYQVDYSCDGQNWSSKEYSPTAGCTVELSLGGAR